MAKRHRPPEKDSSINRLVCIAQFRMLEKALAKSGQKIHLIGHSLGGIIPRDCGAAAGGYRVSHHLGVRRFAGR
jgi:hypothetical protein